MEAGPDCDGRVQYYTVAFPAARSGWASGCATLDGTDLILGKAIHGLGANETAMNTADLVVSDFCFQVDVLLCLRGICQRRTRGSSAAVVLACAGNDWVSFQL